VNVTGIYHKPILILFSNLSLGLPNGLFLQVFPTKTLYVYPSPMYATSPAHHTLHNLIIPKKFGEGITYCSSSLRIFPCSCICSLLAPHIFPESYSRTFSAWDFTQNDRPSSAPILNNTQYISVFNFWSSSWNDRTFWAKWQHVLPEFNLLLLFTFM
jgi:hypothetical protein